MQLDHVAVLDRVFGAGLLTVEYALSPDTRKFQVPGDLPVHQPGDIHNRIAAAHRERLVGIGRFAGGFGVDTNDFECAKQEWPYFFQAVSGFSRYGYRRKTQPQQFFQNFCFPRVRIEVTLVGYQ